MANLSERLIAELRAKDKYAPRSVDDLIRRLRGEYRTPITDGLGPAGGEEPDNAREHVRTFPGTPAIQTDAAFVIAGMSKALDRLTVEGLAGALLADAGFTAAYIDEMRGEDRPPWLSAIRRAKALIDYITAPSVEESHD